MRVDVGLSICFRGTGVRRPTATRRKAAAGPPRGDRVEGERRLAEPDRPVMTRLTFFEVVGARAANADFFHGGMAEAEKG